MKNIIHNAHAEGASTKIKFYTSIDKKVKEGSLITDLKTFKIIRNDGRIVFEESLKKISNFNRIEFVIEMQIDNIKYYLIFGDTKKHFLYLLRTTFNNQLMSQQANLVKDFASSGCDYWYDLFKQFSTPIQDVTSIGPIYQKSSTVLNVVVAIVLIVIITILAVIMF